MSLIKCLKFHEKLEAFLLESIEYGFHFRMDRMWLSFLLLVFSMLVVIACIIRTTNENHNIGSSGAIKKRSSNFDINRTTERTQIKLELVSESRRKTENLSTLNDTILSADLHHKHHHGVRRNETGGKAVDPNASFKETRQNTKTHIYKRNIVTDNTSMETKEKQQWNYTSFTETRNFSFCSFSFDKNSLQETRKKLAELQQQSAHLFYVSLYTDTNLDSFSTEHRDNLLHWQYVLKKERFLILMPVDFDLLSFYIFANDNEEKVLRMKILYNNSNCIENFSHAFESLQLLLWTELFANDTNYYLCHNNFDEKVPGRTILYAITSTWIGYDLSCSTSTNVADNEYEAKKDTIIFIAQGFCFFLALQFVWVFLILDLSFNNKQTCTGTYTPIYTRNEKPYGLKQFIYKLFFYDFDSAMSCCRPITRLICTLLFCNLIVGFYRSYGRYHWSEMFFVDYLNVARPNEYFVYLIYLIFDIPPILVFILDFIYAVIFPFSFLCLGKQLHELYLSKKMNLCPQSLCQDKKDKDKITKMDASFGNKIIVPCYLLCNRRKLCPLGHNCVLFFSSFLPVCLFNWNAYHACSCTSQKYEYLLKSLAFLSTFVFCLRPIISSFTFLLRSFTYLIIVALPIRPEIMRNVLLAITISVYFIKYIHEIININAEILEYIFQVKESDDESETECVEEEMFSAIYNHLFFMRKKLYFVLFKIGIVCAYLIFMTQVLGVGKISGTNYNIKEVVDVVLLAVGPYAFFLFVKANNNTFLTDDDKQEIQREYESYKTPINEHSSSLTLYTNDESTPCLQPK